MPADRHWATKPPRARQLRARAVAVGTSAPWGTGARVDGDARRRRGWWDAQPPADVRAVAGQADVGLGGPPRRRTTLVAAWPQDGWTRGRAGDGAQGPRGYDGRWLPLAEPLAPTWRRGLLRRRRLSAATAVRASGGGALDHCTAR